MSDPGPRPVVPLDAPPDAEVVVPGSKSLTNRALVAAALARGTSTLRGVLVADDTAAMVGALGALGVEVAVEGDTARVVGVAGRLPAGPATLDARQSGTTARFLLPVLCLGQGPYVLDGDPQLRARPFADQVAALRHLGATVVEVGDPGGLPLRVEAAGLDGGEVAVAGYVSSQFLSGLLLAGPATRHGLTVRVTTPLVSEPYVVLTTDVMATFGAEVAIDGSTWTVAPTGYRAAELVIEPDASAAAYFFAAAAMTGGRVRVRGLGVASRQGDLALLDVLEAMGASVSREADATVVEGTGALHGVDVDLRDLSDQAPTVAVVAAAADSPTRVRGIGFIRAKESDRVGGVVAELRRCGVEAVEEPDGFVVRPDPARRPRFGPAVVRTADDHRMAMSFALLGLVSPGIAIEQPGCVAKTFPGFWDALDGLHPGGAAPSSPGGSG